MSIKEQLKHPWPGKRITGHDFMGLERFGEDTRHMIIFDVLTWDCPVGDKGERVRIFITDEGYEKSLESEGRGEMKIIRHARVHKGVILHDPPGAEHER